ncbi:MAG TPA: AmmeMemoRadiSam system protein B [Polyangia bacterium]|nr:AmmeMemoRadiSam system protein B [Polyangia bacterium]
METGMAAGGLDVRQPAVSGRFYPARPEELRAEVARCLGGEASGGKAHHGVVAPHAGYVYSGAIAGKVFADTTVPRRVVVLAPNHTGRGERAAVWARGAFALPGDSVPVDEELAARLIEAGVGFVADREAHRHEHALEVELPFLRARNPQAMVTPVILGGLDGAECVALGRALAEIVARLDEDVLVVASSDMSHYLPDDVTRTIDQRAIDAMLACDAERLYDVVEREDISMCGVLPATAMLSYARARGATRGTLIAYGTSGDAFGDTDRVVGYAGIAID